MKELISEGNRMAPTCRSKVFKEDCAPEVSSLLGAELAKWFEQKSYRVTPEELFVLLPAFAAYETNQNKKEHYNELLSMLREAVKEDTLGNPVLFAALVDGYACLSEEIFETYHAVRGLARQTYQKASTHIKKPPKDAFLAAMMAYGLYRGCLLSVFQTEKYLETADSWFSFANALQKEQKDVKGNAEAACELAAAAKRCLVSGEEACL